MLFPLMLDRHTLAPDRIRPLRRTEFMRLAEAGDFEDERVELLRGEIVVMSPPGPAHVMSTARISRALSRQLDLTVEVLTQSSLALWDDSMPEPDVAVVIGGSFDEYAPQAVLVVEVADSSWRKDTLVKAPLYAERVPVYWLVDLAHRAVRVYSHPIDGEYSRWEHFGPGDVLTLDGYPQVAIAVADILPPAT